MGFGPTRELWYGIAPAKELQEEHVNGHAPGVSKTVSPEKLQAVDLQAGKRVGEKEHQAQPHIPPPETDKNYEREIGYER